MTNHFDEIAKAQEALEQALQHVLEGDFPAAGQQYELAAKLSEPRQAAEYPDEMEVIRVEAIQGFGNLLTPWEEAATIGSLIEEVRTRNSSVGRRMLPGLYVKLGWAWSSSGGWRDALQAFEQSRDAAALLGDDGQIGTADLAIQVAKRNLPSD